MHVYCEIVPFNKVPDIDESVKGIILSGSPFSVAKENALHADLKKLIHNIPVLAICYGAQYIANQMGGLVQPSAKREYGKAILKQLSPLDALFEDVPENDQVWHWQDNLWQETVTEQQLFLFNEANADGEILATIDDDLSYRWIPVMTDPLGQDDGRRHGHPGNPRGVGAKSLGPCRVRFGHASQRERRRFASSPPRAALDSYSAPRP